MVVSMKTLERPCPYCAEMIKVAAVVCRFCNRELPTESPAFKNASAPAYSPCKRCGGVTRSAFMELTDGLCRGCAIATGKVAEGEQFIDESYIYGERGMAAASVAPPQSLSAARECHPAANQNQCATSESVAVQKQRQQPDQGGAGCFLCAIAIGVPILCAGALSSNHSSSEPYKTTNVAHQSPADEELMNRPSLRGFSDSEKRTIVDAAKDFDRKVRDLERRRGY